MLNKYDKYCFQKYSCKFMKRIIFIIFDIPLILNNNNIYVIMAFNK